MLRLAHNCGISAAVPAQDMTGATKTMVPWSACHCFFKNKVWFVQYLNLSIRYKPCNCI